MAELDYEVVLSWDKAHLASGSEMGLVDDKNIVVYWEMPANSDTELAKAWAKSNRLTITNSTIDFKQFEGTWRLVKLDIQISKDKTYNLLVLSYSYGWAESLIWTEARLVEDSVMDGQTAAGITGDGSTFVDEEWLLVRFPNINPKKVRQVAYSAGQTKTYSNLTINTESYSGDYYLVYSKAKIEEDGSGSVYLFLAKPTYKLDAFTSYGGSDQKTVTYIWGIQKSTAQAVLNAYKADGASATATFEKEGFVDLIIYSADNASSNLESDAVQTCDLKTTSFHFLWGTNKTSATDFVNQHGTGGANTGKTSTIDVHTRGDGLYDATAVIETWTQSGPHTWEIISTNGSGGGAQTAYVKTVQHGFNYTATAMAAIETEYTQTEVGTDRTLDITVNDHCLFNWTGTKIVKSHVSSTETFTLPAGTLEVKSGASAKPSDVAGLSGTDNAIGTSIDLDLDIREDGLTSYRFKKYRKTVVTGHGHCSDGLYYKENITKAINDNPDNIPDDSGATTNQEISVDFSLNDDGTCNWTEVSRLYTIPSTPIVIEGTAINQTRDRILVAGNGYWTFPEKRTVSTTWTRTYSVTPIAAPYSAESGTPGDPGYISPVSGRAGQISDHLFYSDSGTISIGTWVSNGLPTYTDNP